MIKRIGFTSPELGLEEIMVEPIATPCAFHIFHRNI